MKSIKIRKIVTNIHRYVGLLVGLILMIVGLTGSLLVFEHEMDDWSIQQQFGRSTPQSQVLPLGTLVKTVKTAYADYPDWQMSQIQMTTPDFYTMRLSRPDKTTWEVFVDPYSGQIIGDRQRETALFSRVLNLHYGLLAGDVGMQIVGIAALFLCVLSITGIVLWPGWRKLTVGFKIKWDAHPKRFNFDIHKVAGIIAAGFLGATAFTGFCWNFYDQTIPLIYAATLTPPPAEVHSEVIQGQPPLGLNEIMDRADRAFPGAANTYIMLPNQPDGSIAVYKKRPGDMTPISNAVKLDQYSGKVLAVQDGRTAKLGDRLLNAFIPIHYGTFGGIATRIFYVFVGLTPTVLMVTGVVMWWLRKKPSKPQKAEALPALME